MPTTKAACSSVRLQADTHFEKAAQALLPRHPAQPPPTCTWRHGRRGLCTSPIACRHCFHTVLACGVVLRPRNPSCRATPRSRHRCVRAWRHGRPWGGGVGTPSARHAQDALPQKPGPGRGRQPEGGWLCSACKYWAGWGRGNVCHVQEEVSRTLSDGPGRDQPAAVHFYDCPPLCWQLVGCSRLWAAAGSAWGNSPSLSMIRPLIDPSIDPIPLPFPTKNPSLKLANPPPCHSWTAAPSRWTAARRTGATASPYH